MRKPILTLFVAITVGALVGAGGLAVGLASQPDAVTIHEARQVAAEEITTGLSEVTSDVDTTAETLTGLVQRGDRQDAAIAAAVERLAAIEARLAELDRYLRARTIRPASYTTSAAPTVAGQELPATLRRIGGCESVWDPDGALVWTADNPAPAATASGAFGVTDPTWRGWARTYGADVGAASYARALHAPPAVQVAVVRAAYKAQGTTPWRASSACWA